jgi:hypothetical protein
MNTLFADLHTEICIPPLYLRVLRRHLSAISIASAGDDVCFPAGQEPQAG